MSVLPYWWTDDEDFYLRQPSRLLDQHFGLVLDPEQILKPFTELLTRNPAGYVRNWRSSSSEKDTGSTVTCNRQTFEAKLDVSQFKPEEITVRVTGRNVVTVEGEHKEQPDKYGQIFRHFVRRYVLPRNCNMNKIESKLSSDGVLTITVPRVVRRQFRPPQNVSVRQTGKPVRPPVRWRRYPPRRRWEGDRKQFEAKKVEDKKEENKKEEDKKEQYVRDEDKAKDVKPEDVEDDSKKDEVVKREEATEEDQKGDEKKGVEEQSEE